MISGTIEERLSRLEGFHDKSFNGEISLLLGLFKHTYVFQIFLGNWKHFILFIGHNILLLGGLNSDGYSNAATVFNKELNCNPLKNLPVSFDAAVGAFTGEPLVCGGYNGSSFLEKCFKYQSDNWFHFASLQTNRRSAAGVVLNSGTFWVTGKS